MSQINLQHGTTTNSGETGRLESKNGYAQKYISVNRSKGPATPLTPTQSAQTIREPTIIIGADFRRATVAIAARGENTFRFGPPGCRPVIVGTPPSAVVTLFFRSLHYFHFRSIWVLCSLDNLPSHCWTAVCNCCELFSLHYTPNRLELFQLYT